MSHQFSCSDNILRFNKAKKAKKGYMAIMHADSEHIVIAMRSVVTVHNHNGEEITVRLDPSLLV
jgi:hypothetical protein